MKKMAEPIRIYNVKQAIRTFIIGFLIGFFLTAIALAFKSYLSIRDKEVIEYNSRCIAYKNAIDKLYPMVANGNPDAIEEFNNLIRKFEENGCNQFYPLF